MAYFYKSSNPVEASLVEAFFTEKGYICHLIPTGGVYGMQTYDVYVSGEVDEATIAELNARLGSTNPSEEP
jgi:hypothetical protein